MRRTFRAACLFAAIWAASGTCQAGNLPGIWVEAESAQGHMNWREAVKASGGKAAQHFTNAGKTLGFTFNAASDMTQARLYVRYARGTAGEGPLDVYVAPADATTYKAAGVKKIGQMQLASTGRWDTFGWASMALGKIGAGEHRIFVVCPVNGAAGDLDLFGVINDTHRGLWVPPNTVVNGALTGEATLKAPVEIATIQGPNTGNILPAGEYLGDKAKSAPFVVTLKNNLQDSANVTLTTQMKNDLQTFASPAAQSFSLNGGESRTVTLNVIAPGFGWYGLDVVAESEKIKSERASSFVVVRPAAEGVRPESIFGLNIGDKQEDREIAKALGVKWRRGIPFTHPDIVAPKPGSWWGPNEIAKARQAVQDWKDAGVLCLGYQDYTTKWNSLPDPLGRPMAQHQNRPKDFNVQADIMYHMIQPLHDLVKHWETWNEPWVHGWTWRTGEAQDFRDMSKIIYERIKPDMPDVMLIGGGSTSYLRDVVYAKGSPNTGYIDGSCTHPYGPPDVSTPTPPALESYMNAHFSKGKGVGGIWATEVGTGEMMFETLPEEQRPFQVARSVAPIYLLNKLGAGETPIHIFFFASMFDRSFSGQEFNWWWGRDPRPAVAAFATLTHFTEDAKIVGDIFSASKAAWAIHMVKPDATNVVVFWTEEGYQGDMIIPAQGFDVYDYLGRPIGKREGESLRFPVRQWEARYIISKVKPEAVAAAIASAKFEGLPALRINPRSFIAPLDRKPALRVKVENNLPQSIAGWLEVSTPAEITLASHRAELPKMAPGEVRYVEFPIQSAKANAMNRYTIQYRASANGVEQKGSQAVQVACATYGTPKIDADLSDWRDATPVTMISRGGKDYQQIALNPDQAAQLMANTQAAETAIYKVWTRWDQENFYLAAEVPDSTLQTNSTFKDDPYAFPFLADHLQFAFDCLAKNPDDLLAGHKLYEKSLAADVDYEFDASLARLTNDGPGFSSKPAWTGDRTKAPQVPQLFRFKAPGTNYQTYYPTNAVLTPPLGAMEAGEKAGREGQVAVRYDYEKGMLYYEVAIPWSCITELGTAVRQLKNGQALQTHFAFGVGDAGKGGRGSTYWTQEAGDVQPGSYGFSPTWGGGSSRMGGRIITDWGFAR